MASTYANPGAGDAGAEQVTLGKELPALNNLCSKLTQALRAEFVGSNTCATVDITATGSAPVLSLCRSLIRAGLDPDAALLVFRGAILALRIRTIGEAAQLEINPKGTGFVKRRSAVPTASPMCPIATDNVGDWVDWPAVDEGVA